MNKPEDRINSDGRIDPGLTKIPDGAVHVKIRREPFLPWFTLELDNGYSEELEPDEARNWFRERGANMDVVERALDHVWNFYQGELWIGNYTEPTLVNPAVSPNI